MDKIGNRILLLEPDFFSDYPVSNRCIDFMLALGKNIPELQVYVGSFDTFCAQYDVNTFYYKEHPLNTHYRGIKDSRDWMIESVCGYYPSFFSYWKKIQTPLMLQYS
jgi:deoxyribodipyrimidine photo-lyase